MLPTSARKPESGSRRVRVYGTYRPCVIAASAQTRQVKLHGDVHSKTAWRLMHEKSDWYKCRALRCDSSEHRIDSEQPGLASSCT